MISFIICALNEEDNLKDTVNSIYKAIKKSGKIKNYQIIIVDDGSTDSTYEISKALEKLDKNIVVCKNEKNLGYGESLKKGLKKVIYEKFMVIPGDNDLTELTIFAGLKNINSADLIMIFPINIENRSKLRNVVSIIFKMLYLIFFNCYVNYINSPSIYPTKIVKTFNLKSKRFSIISEITTKLLHNSITYVEVPTIFKKSLRVRQTVTIKNLIEVIISFFQLLFEIKFINKESYNNKAERNYII